MSLCRFRLFGAFAAATLLMVACGGDSASTTSDAASAATVTTSVVDTTSTITVSPEPNAAPMVAEGEISETARAFQWLLNCNGYGSLTVDGAYGPASQAAMEVAQAAMNREVTGFPDEGTLAQLSRSCDDIRPVAIDDHDFGQLVVVGHTDPLDPEVLSLSITAGDQLSVTPDSTGVVIDVLNDAGVGIGTKNGDGSWETIFSASGDYSIRMSSTAPTTFEITLQFFKSDSPVDDDRPDPCSVSPKSDTPPPCPTSEMKMGPNGLTFGLDFGDDAETVITGITAALGAAWDDSGWIPIAEVYSNYADSIRNVRFVTWGSGDCAFMTEFRDSESRNAADGTPHFFSYSGTCSRADDGYGTPILLETPDGLGYDTTVEELLAAGIQEFGIPFSTSSDWYFRPSQDSPFGMLCFGVQNSKVWTIRAQGRACDVFDVFYEYE